ncbi:hypothetical protein ACTXN4_01790 [Pseudomonas helleri]|uniref:hypothetical protein n=1 Tax=Pseudomonas helleri TaxID=1608996 RepID=UPI003F9CDBF7
MKSESLEKAVTAMRGAVQSDTPTMFWGEAMKHIALLLEHVQSPSNVTGSIQLARAAISESRLTEAAEHLQRVLHCLHAQTSEHVVRLSDLLVNFDAALEVKPFLWLEIGFNRVSGWMITIYDKAGGFERVVVQVEGLRTDDTCQWAAHQLQAFIKEESYD